jgi:hypothetical protein
VVIGVLVDLRIFGPECVKTDADAEAAERLLSAVVLNGCLTLAPGEVVGELDAITQAMPSRTGQKIRLLVAEVVVRRHSVEAKGFPGVDKGLAWCKRLKALAVHALPNIAVYGTDEQKRCLEEAGNATLEIRSLLEYARSDSEAMRQRWWDSKPALLNLSIEQRRHVLLHAIRYAQEIVIADRMIGRQVNDSDKRGLMQSVRGICWLVDIWVKGSPLARMHQPKVRIVTQGGPLGARGGYVDPASTRASLESLIRSKLRELPDLKVEIVLKRDTQPSIFKERYLRANNRTFLIQHGVADLGMLAAEEDGGAQPTSRPSVYIHRCDVGDASDLDRILALPDA